MKTFRRDKLRRLVEAGKVETVGTYSFDDMTGSSRGTKRMPVAMWPGDWRLCKEGTCYLRPDEFTTKSGCCYVRDDSGPNGAIITLIVHGNSNYDLRVLPSVN